MITEILTIPQIVGNVCVHDVTSRNSFHWFDSIGWS